MGSFLVQYTVLVYCMSTYLLWIDVYTDSTCTFTCSKYIVCRIEVKGRLYRHLMEFTSLKENDILYMYLPACIVSPHHQLWNIWPCTWNGFNRFLSCITLGLTITAPVHVVGVDCRVIHVFEGWSTDTSKYECLEEQWTLIKLTINQTNEWPTLGI